MVDNPNNSPQRFTSQAATQGGDDLHQAADHILAGLGRSMTDHERERRRRSGAAGWSAQICGRCGRDLRPDGPSRRRPPEHNGPLPPGPAPAAAIAVVWMEVATIWLPGWAGCGQGGGAVNAAPSSARA